MENPWLTVALAPPLKPPTPAGNLSHSPPQPDPPDPPDPLQFPPLPSPLSGGQKPPKRRTFSPLPLISTVPPVPITSSLSLGTAESPVFGSLPSTTSSAAQLLAAFSSILFCGVENPRSDSSTSGPTPVPTSSDRSQNPPVSLPSTPAVSSLQPETEIDPPSMEIDSPCPTKETIIDCSDMDFSSAEASVLALPAVFKDRPIIISNNLLPTKKPSILSLNPFCSLPSDTPTHHPTQPPPLSALLPPSSNTEPSPIQTQTITPSSP
ncbi:unnamed protein product, partial [Brassica rapa subsp. narinosa]